MGPVVPTTPGERTLFRAIDNLCSGQPNGGKMMETRGSITEILKGVDPAALQAQIKERLVDLTALTRNLEAGKTAIDLLRLANQEAIALLGISMPPAEAEKQWLAKSWEERTELLAQMQSQALTPVIDLMLRANDNIKVRTFLQQALNKIVIPADQAVGYIQLMALLEELSQNKLVLATDRPPADKENIAIVKPGGTTIYYRPNPVVPISPASWHVLKEAETRAKRASNEAKKREEENRQKATIVASHATIGLTLAAILDGSEEGNYFLSLPSGHGALIRFSQQPESLRVEFLENTYNFTWNPIVVSRDGEFRALRGRWPSAEYAALLQQNLQREKGIKVQKGEEKTGEEKALEERLSAILSLATLPEAGGVTRLLNGEPGVAVAYCQDYRQPDGDKGLIAVALEHRPGEDNNLWLIEALSDHSSLDFGSLRKEPLPPMSHDEKTGKLKYAEYLSGFPPAAYRALMALRTVLQMAVNAERQDQARSRQ